MNSFKFKGWLGVIAMACLTHATAHAATYNFQTVNNPTDLTFNQLLGINNSGTIVGYYGSGSATAPNKGYSYSGGTFTNENFPGSVQTQVVGINNNASPTTVGFWVDGNGNNFGFTKQGTTFTNVSNPNVPTTTSVTQLLGVNNSNVAAGFYTDANGNNQGFTYTLGTGAFNALALPSSFGAVMTTATDINNSGTISGFFADGAGAMHGFVDNSGTFNMLNDPNGTNTQVLGLNNKGEYVGSYVDANGTTNGFVYDSLTGTWMTVDDPNNSATAAFNVTGTTINGVNDFGQVVGFYSDGTNVDGFVATPTPEPASLSLLGLGLLGGGLVFRRKTAR